MIGASASTSKSSSFQPASTNPVKTNTMPRAMHQDVWNRPPAPANFFDDTSTMVRARPAPTPMPERQRRKSFAMVPCPSFRAETRRRKAAQTGTV